ncbi:MAG: hypothetical protein HUJ75_04760, partial [Parasporobacterium sp.]|nr:hypothetical protein [Parasporobacterium sp.]
MTFFSIPFLIWAGLGLIFYYALPKKSQWIVLLCVSLGFYFYAGWVLFLIFAVQVLTVYLFALSIPKLKGKSKKAVFALEIVIMLAALVLIKIGGAALGPIKTDFWMGFGWDESSLIIPLGISYYTLMLISYSIDVYREDIVPERNFFKLLLFAGFFPSVVQGPFNRYNDLAPQFYEPHKFTGEEFTEGFLRFGWGIFKKMVVANRIAVLVNNIWAADKAPGIYVLLALLLYVFQLYADFSGFIDTSIGVAKMFGITIPENFEKPYFS